QLISQTTREPTRFRTFWGNGLVSIAVAGTLCSLLVVSGGHLFFPTLSIRLLVTLAAADLCIGPLVDISSSAFVTFERVRASTAIFATVSVLRLGAAASFALLDGVPTPERWAVWYLGSTAVAALIAQWMVARKLGGPLPDLVLLRQRALNGAYFAV